MERPINQRIKFILETLQMSARDFSRALGVADNNTQNYLEPRFAQPKADYLEKIMLHFESISSSWLLTGKGEPFITTDSTQAQEANANLSKNKIFSNSQVSGGKNNTATQTQGGSATELAALQTLVEQLRSQLADKERTIQILLSHQQPK